VKVFPCSAMGGASYLRALKAPLPEIKLVPTGGVSLATAKDFIAAGAWALGVGADLVNTKAIKAGDSESVVAAARNYVAAVREARAALA
jgi:2-dehydro-3-deoxyphosphogluconate aldolase/(4S)-4-hydroxy-2-oxoglutarate aldolase